MSFRGILFDLDNTLVDRPRSLSQYAAQFANHFGQALLPIDLPRLDRLIQEADGGGYRPKAEMFAILARDLPWQESPSIDQLQRHWFDTYPGCTQGMEGLHSTLAALRAKNLLLGLVTNGSSKTQNAKVDLLELRPLLDGIAISEEAQIKKPDRRLFALALDQIGLKAEEALFVGDHPINDMLGAAVAGLTPVWFRGSHPWPAAGQPPKLQIDALAQLVPLFNNLEADPGPKD